MKVCMRRENRIVMHYALEKFFHQVTGYDNPSIDLINRIVAIHDPLASHYLSRLELVGVFFGMRACDVARVIAGEHIQNSHTNRMNYQKNTAGRRAAKYANSTDLHKRVLTLALESTSEYSYSFTFDECAVKLGISKKEIGPIVHCMTNKGLITRRSGSFRSMHITERGAALLGVSTAPKLPEANRLLDKTLKRGIVENAKNKKFEGWAKYVKRVLADQASRYESRYEDRVAALIIGIENVIERHKESSGELVEHYELILRSFADVLKTVLTQGKVNFESIIKTEDPNAIKHVADYLKFERTCLELRRIRDGRPLSVIDAAIDGRSV